MARLELNYSTSETRKAKDAVQDAEDKMVEAINELLTSNVKKVATKIASDQGIDDEEGLLELIESLTDLVNVQLEITQEMPKDRTAHVSMFAIVKSMKSE